MVSLLRHDIDRLTWHPLTYWDLIIFVTQAQHTFLDIFGHMDLVEYAQNRMRYGTMIDHLSSAWGDLTEPVNTQWIGCFTQDSAVCDELMRTGVPVWLIQVENSLFADMNIIRPVLLTFPDTIV
ncbi:hypothetical protein BJ138DRAFT_1118325 [Hygrophoropsis aurantiaca]|uniref:Uncharacterized protein n=1 Tax=Hygrophoropsis aurantiaca TaxID=72124 RepID=A0ACB7ZXY4_9AGAM|nr:hypothetical protein BJ138DRAFT_1118325 [Hygrophoropsis aurantiaca]